MKQILGGILSIGGLIGVLFFGYKYLDDSESFSFLGVDVAVSTGDYVPILISLVILIVGVVIYRSKQSEKVAMMIFADGKSTVMDKLCTFFIHDEEYIM